MLGLMSGLFLFSCDNGISFDDPALDACVRDAAPITDESHLDQIDLDKITTLVCGEDTPGFEENGISNLSGIERLHNLRYLLLYKARISDISQLAKLEKLRELIITSELKIYSYAPLSKLSLTSLTLHVGLDDISFLANIPTLEEINLERNQISDLTPIKQLTNLKKIDVSYNRITTIKPIAEHPNIENFTYISIGYNCMDCSVEEQNVLLVEEKNPEVYISCNSDNQLLPENCGE
ncbi:MAG TPA: hypothetical protein PLV42_03295 [bacterium]|nr:hypothetical protein [bacterium]